MAFVWRFLTSYPMRVVDPCYFVDRVTGKSVKLYRDRHGRLWMAETRWDLDRVASFASEVRNA